MTAVPLVYSPDEALTHPVRGSGSDTLPDRRNVSMAACGLVAPLMLGATSMATPEHMPSDVVGLTRATTGCGVAVVGYDAPP
jgi:hypothetical protein